MFMKGYNSELVVKPEVCYRAWKELGTLQKVVNHFTEKGLLNPITGRPYSVPTVRRLAFMYMLDNIDAVYEELKAEGRIGVPKRMWEEYLVKSAPRVLHKRGFIHWLYKNGFEKKYEHIYKGKISITRAVNEAL